MTSKNKTGWLSLAVSSLLALPAMAEEAAADAASTALNGADTAWIIVASALVLMMTLPGLALFYGGLVRSKNVLSILVQCFAITAIMSLLWVAFGYSFASTSSGSEFLNGFIGNGDKIFLQGITVDSMVETSDGVGIPESLYVMFQMTFAIITPALIVGAFAERMKFSAVLIFSTIWFIISYIPVWHMAWGGGWFHAMGAIDFAGGTVVHINAAVAGLVACLFIGKRKGFGTSPMHPHSVPMVLTGAGLLWVGWFGFNAGSALAADGSAAMAMLVTHVATATAVVTWMIVEWIVDGKPTAVGVATGAVAGLVAITPAAGDVGPMGAMGLGLISGVVCFFFATRLKHIFKYDDSLDVFGVHGAGAIVGAIFAGVFCCEEFGGSGGNLESMGAQVWAQTASVLITIAWSGVATIIGLVIAKVCCGGLRVDDKTEIEGLDYAEHGETSYSD